MRPAGIAVVAPSGAPAAGIGPRSAAPGPRPGRLEQADLVRAAATLLVVAIHCLAWPAQARGAAATVYPAAGLLARVSVPLFVVLSGLLLAHAHPRIRSPGQFWSRRLRRTLVPWALWAGIYFGLTVGFQGMSPLPSQSWGWWAGGAGHLYFLLLIPQLYLLYLLWPKSGWGVWLALGGALAMQLGVQLARVLLPVHGGWEGAATLNYGFEEAPFWVGYFALGITLGLHQGRLPQALRSGWLAAALTGASAAVLLLGLTGTVATHWGPWVNGTGGFLRPSLVLLTAAVFLDLWLLEPRLRAWAGERFSAPVRSLSRNSLGVYIIHPALLLALGPLLEVANRPLSLREPLPTSLLPLSLLLAAATSLAWAASSLLGRSRVAAWTVGLA